MTFEAIEKSLYIRKLTIKSKDLGAKATLMLTIQDPDNPGLHVENFPVCWRVGTFEAIGSSSMSATYVNQFAFSRPRVVHGKIVSAKDSVNINISDQTDLNVDRCGDYHFSNPTNGSDGELQVTNQTGTKQAIALGFNTGSNDDPIPFLYFNHFSNDSNVMAQLTPILQIHVTSDYQENQILRGGIPAPLIWRKILAFLDESTTLVLTRDRFSGIFSLVPANQDDQD